MVLEAAATIGGGARTEELTLPGFHHDVCSAVLPLGIGSPFLRSLALEDHGLEWVHPETPLAHPLEEGAGADSSARSWRTAAGLEEDGPAWRSLFGPLAQTGTHWPTRRSLLCTGRAARVRSYGSPRVRRARPKDWRMRPFPFEPARALFAGIAAHGILPLSRRPTAAVALLILGRRRTRWAGRSRGAEQAGCREALASLLISLGGEILTGREVSVAVRAAARPGRPARRHPVATPPDRGAPSLTPIPAEARRLPLRRGRFQARPGAGRADPLAAEACRRAGNGPRRRDAPRRSRPPSGGSRGPGAERPFVLVAQPTLFDPGRAPAGKHIAWAYCHVPNGWRGDESAAIEAQIEAFAPGFRDRILARSARGPREFEARNRQLRGRRHRGRSHGPPAVLRPALSPPSRPMRPSCGASTCARPLPRRVPGFTGCADTMRRGPRCGACDAHPRKAGRAIR